MAARILFSAPEDHWALWRPHLLAAFAAEGLDVDLTDDPAGAYRTSQRGFFFKASYIHRF